MANGSVWCTTTPNADFSDNSLRPEALQGATKLVRSDEDSGYSACRVVAWVPGKGLGSVTVLGTASGDIGPGTPIALEGDPPPEAPDVLTVSAALFPNAADRGDAAP